MKRTHALQVAAKALSDATLVAPISGYISKKSIEIGDTASAGRPVFEIVQLDPVEVNVGVPETDVHLVKIGQKASVTLPALPSQSFEGTVRIINVAADPGTRTYMTRISVPNPGHVTKNRDGGGGEDCRRPEDIHDDRAG